MDRDLQARIKWRKEFLLKQGVLEEVIATLNLEDCCDHDELVIQMGEEEGYLYVCLFSKDSFHGSGSMTLNVLDTMLGALCSHRKGQYTKLRLCRGDGANATPIPENSFPRLAELLSNVLAKHAPNLKELGIKPIENLFQITDDFAIWCNFLLQVVARFRHLDVSKNISKLTLLIIAGPEVRSLFQQLPTLLPNLETLELWYVDLDHVDTNWLAELIGGFPDLHTLVLLAATYVDGLEIAGTSDHFGPIKLAIQAHPKVKSFTWHTGAHHVISAESVTPQALIDGLPNLQSIRFGAFPTANAESTARDIVKAVEAHDNLQQLHFPGCLIPKSRQAWPNRNRHWTKVPLDVESQTAIQKVLDKNRLKALLGEEPTFRQWVVAMVAFRHEPAILCNLLQEGLGAGPSYWVPHAMAGIGPSKDLAWRHCGSMDSLTGYKRARDEEEELGRKKVALQKAQFK